MARGPNLIVNGGFDNNTAGWADDVSCTLASIGGGQPGNCLELTKVSGTLQSTNQLNIPVISGGTYSFSGSIKAGTSGPGESYVFDLYNSSWGSLLSLPGGTASVWTIRTGTFVNPVGNAVVHLLLIKGTATAGTMLFDSIEMFNLSSGNLNLSLGIEL